jgi:plasmid stability protein
MAYLTIRNLDEALKHRFKVACVTNQYTMTEVITLFMEDYVRRCETANRGEALSVRR